MSGSGKGGDNRGNRRKLHKRRDWENHQSQPREASKNGGKKAADLFPAGEGRVERARGGLFDRPKWVPPKPPALNLPAATCAWCEKPIKDIMTAICEPDSGMPVHFDCVISRIAEREALEAGDTVGYIGGGRFGIIHFNTPESADARTSSDRRSVASQMHGPLESKDFKIKKVFEWERKENHCEWRAAISDYFSAT